MLHITEMEKQKESLQVKLIFKQLDKLLKHLGISISANIKELDELNYTPFKKTIKDNVIWLNGKFSGLS